MAAFGGKSCSHLFALLLYWASPPPSSFIELLAEKCIVYSRITDRSARTLTRTGRRIAAAAVRVRARIAGIGTVGARLAGAALLFLVTFLLFLLLGTLLILAVLGTGPLGTTDTGRVRFLLMAIVR